MTKHTPSQFRGHEWEQPTQAGVSVEAPVPAPPPPGDERSCAECEATFAGTDARFCPFDGSELIAQQGLSGTADPLLGGLLGERYQVVERLGQGGMGAVYRVRHAVLGKEFAAKVLRAELARDAELAQRFTREARAMARIANAHVIQITDFGELEDGRPYFVMELLKGESLSTWLKQGKVTSEAALAIAAATVDALAAAHEAGIVHRDLKPDNITVAEAAAGSLQVKVLDFGLAHVVGQSRLTRRGVVYGTPQYMSPEQASGEPVDQRSDVYALGVVLYEMLAGHAPFEADSYMGVLTKQIYAQPKPLREVEAARGVPPQLAEIVARCLQKKPEARYQTMRELGRALDSVGEAVLGSMRSGRHSGAPQAPVSRRWWAVLALLCGLGALLSWALRDAGGERLAAPPPQGSVAVVAAPSSPPVPRQASAPLPAASSTPAVRPVAEAPRVKRIAKPPSQHPATASRPNPAPAPAPKKASPLSNPDLIDPWSQ